MMKVLFLTNLPAPYRVDFFNEFSKYCELTVLFEREEASDRNSTWYGTKFHFKHHFLRSLKVREESSLSFEVIKYLKQDFDFIIIGGYSTITAMIAIEYLKRKKIPFILNTDGGFIPEKENKIKYLIKKHFISSAQWWLSTGKMTHAYLEHYGAKRENIYLYPFTSLYEKDFDGNTTKTEARKALGIKEEKILLYVGSIIPRKRVSLLVEVCGNLKDTQVYIVGGEETEELKEIRSKNKITNITFVSHTSKEKLKMYYDSADLFVFFTSEDIWGLVVLEALSRGLPVLTTTGCGAGMELIKEEQNGFLIDVNEDNVSNLRKEVTRDLEKVIQGELSKKTVMKSVENYTIENMAYATNRILKQLN